MAQGRHKTVTHGGGASGGRKKRGETAYGRTAAVHPRTHGASPGNATTPRTSWREAAAHGNGATRNQRATRTTSIKQGRADTGDDAR